MPAGERLRRSNETRLELWGIIIQCHNQFDISWVQLVTGRGFLLSRHAGLRVEQRLQGDLPRAEDPPVAQVGRKVPHSLYPSLPEVQGVRIVLQELPNHVGCGAPIGSALGLNEYDVGSLRREQNEVNEAALIADLGLVQRNRAREAEESRIQCERLPDAFLGVGSTRVRHEHVTCRWTIPAG